MWKRILRCLGHQAEVEKFTFWRIFAVQIVLFFAVYGIMLMPRFATDSYSNFFSTGIGLSSMASGRAGEYFLYNAMYALGINFVAVSPLSTAVCTLALSWSAAVLLSLLKSYFSSPSPNWLTVLLLELGVVLAYTNIYFAESYTFSYAGLTLAFGAFFMTLALIPFCHRTQIIGTILAMICLFLSFNFYQVYLGFFMIFGSMIILVRHGVPGARWTSQDAKPLLLDLLRLVLVAGASGAADVLVMIYYSAKGFTGVRGGGSFSLTNIFNNIQQVILQFGYYYPSGYPYYLTGLSKIIFVLSGPVLLCLLAGSFAGKPGKRKRYPLFSLAVTLAVLLGGFMVVFAPHFFGAGAWIPPRSISSFFALFTLVIVVTGFNYMHNGKATPWAETAVVLLLLAANIVAIQGIAMDQITINRRDKAEAEEIVRRVQLYESESGQSVDTISWRPDSRYTWTYPDIKYTFMDMNVRAGARSWGLIGCISYYAGRQFNSETMPDEIWAENFRGQEWDSFDPEGQIRFEGNRMYLMVY